MFNGSLLIFCEQLQKMLRDWDATFLQLLAQHQQLRPCSVDLGVRLADLQEQRQVRLHELGVAASHHLKLLPHIFPVSFVALMLITTGLSKMLARSTTKLVSVMQRPQGIKPLLARSFAHRVNMVLKEDVSNLGFRGDEVSVKAGYARNFLYPEKLAVYATDANRERYKVDKESVDEALLEKEHELEAIIHRLSNIEVVFKRHTAAKTEVKLHSEVNAQNISDMLEKQHGLIVGVARIDLPTPIKTLGEHTVKVRVDDAIEEEYAAGAVVSAAEGEVEAEVEAEGEKKQKKGPSKKKWVSLAIEVERR
ncbi:ribosomal protein L9 [Phytophthora nicotianae INRA-310]|uniref:50S ribosomal protein L9, chloroplastic n=2 Tax=Phytophthora nicotianae TaxID=4792 RepID=W2R7V2_PHYN3|nr:ribosomal protein L9 [Phytophthora nicotianae INRA-310]ETN21306.1 ribosomal protein L9 [Phytophthora nicotianae INRA-310]